MHQQEDEMYLGPKVTGDRKTLPFFLPPEELEAMRNDFYSQISFLLQAMRNIESRGFMFRLDFNGFLHAREVGSV